MRQITKYVADDGSEWNSKMHAEARDRLFRDVNDIMEPLGKLTLEGTQFYQHDPALILRCRVAILRLAAREYSDFEIFHHEPPEEVHPRSVAGRILDDLGGPISAAWNRFKCIDEHGREWEQVYYVLDPPPDAKQVD